MSQALEKVKPGFLDRVYMSMKALTGNIPFQGSGYGGGVPVYSSERAWDNATDRLYGGYANSTINYAAKVGDLSLSSLVMSAIRWLGNTLPEAPLEVKENSGQKGESVVIPDHPLTQLWRKPNDYYSGSTLKKAIAFSWIIKGDAYILKNFSENGAVPVELWYEPHWTCRPAWPVDGSEFIDHYEVSRGGVWISIPKENVIHFRDGIDPMNSRCGFSGIRSILREIYGDNEAGSYWASLMSGVGVPPLVVSVDKEIQMSPDQMTAFSDELTRRVSGDRRGKVLTTQGATVTKLAFNPKELDLRESRYMSEERFCAVMGIPAVVLELGSGMQHSIYNNVKQAEERAYRSYIVPLLGHIEDELDVQLLADFENEGSSRYVNHDLSKVQALQEDQDAKAKRIEGMYSSGVIMRSEARSQLGFGPSDPSSPDDDKVFNINRGISLVLPGEDPLNIAGGGGGLQPATQAGAAAAERPKQNLALVKKALEHAPLTVKQLYMPENGKHAE